MKKEKRYPKIRFLKQTIQDARKIIIEQSPSAEDWLEMFLLYDDEHNLTSYDTEEDFFVNYSLGHGTGSYSVWNRSLGLALSNHSDSTTVTVTAPSVTIIQSVLDVFDSKHTEHLGSTASDSSAISLHQSTLNKITIDKTYNIPGFLINETNLRRICIVASDLVTKDDKEYSSDLIFTTADGKQRTFTNIEDSFASINQDQLVISNLTLSCRHKSTEAVTIAFDKHGRAAVIAVGSSPLFAYEFENLSREITNCQEEYSWGVQKFIQNDLGSSIVSFLLFVFTLSLVFFSLSFLLTRSSLVPFDDKLLVASSEIYYQKLEHAIKSQSQDEKINMLLLNLVKDMRPGSDSLRFFWNGVVISASMLLVTSVLAFFLRVLKKCYPLSLFIFEWNEKTLEQLKRKRDIIGVGIVLAFIINIVAGLVITLVTR